MAVDELPRFNCWRCGAECDVDWHEIGGYGSRELEVIQGDTRCSNRRCAGYYDRCACKPPTPDELVERGRKALQRVWDIAAEVGR